MNGPDGTCSPGCYEVRFGLLRLPRGYSVWWHEEHEHFQGHGPGGAESNPTADRFACRKWCVQHSKQQLAASGVTAEGVRKLIRVLDSLPAFAEKDGAK